MMHKYITKRSMSHILCLKYKFHALPNHKQLIVYITIMKSRKGGKNLTRKAEQVSRENLFWV